jgi:tRNA threonylcarbamoyladenosine biosynthesis protein TsaB
MILGLDTATAGTAVAVWAPGGPEIERRDDPPPGARPAHAGKLLALVEEAIAVSGADWDAIERIAVGVGPGSFTGLRLGIATARALAQARDLPLVGVSSLEALARGDGR